MAWTVKQRQIAGMACRNIGIDEDVRKLLLRQFPNAMYDTTGRKSDDPSSKSSKLTQRDFERYMAVLEDHAGGKLDRFTAGYWQGKAGSQSANAGERMAAKIQALYAQHQEHGGKYSLPGLVYRFSGQRTGEVDELRPQEAWNLIEMLKDLVGRHDSTKPPSKKATQQAKLFSDRELAAAGSSPQEVVNDSRVILREYTPMCDDEIPF